MNRIIRVGKATHLKVTDTYPGPFQGFVSWTACGLIGTPTHGAAYDPQDVDCLNCRRTKEFKDRLTGEKQ